ncbi:MAG: response regulator [Candidatus Omnitrophota bacterium]
MIKILVIDDESGICDIIARTFTCIGFNVSSATSIDKARAVFKREKPRIVFLDLLLGHENGMCLIDEFRQADPEVIVMVLTARGEQVIKDEALKRGADEYIIKPFSRNYLRDVVTARIRDVLDRGGKVIRPKILLVDDQPDLRAGVRQYISSRFDADILEAGDVAETLGKVRECRPDVIFLDIKMPGGSGLDAIAVIKGLSPASRIVVVSAWQSAEVVARAIALGAEDYLGKPVSLSVLGDKLKGLLLSSGKLILKKSPAVG